jgi:hypothetical protein
MVAVGKFFAKLICSLAMRLYVLALEFDAGEARRVLRDFVKDNR